MKTILAPIDFSDATHPVLETASELARALNAKIVLVHVVRPPMMVNEYSPVVERLAVDTENTAQETLARHQGQLEMDGFATETSLLYGNPAICIRDDAARVAADFIVVGSHGHGALYDLVVGSTASDLLKKAPCPVVIVPIKGLKAAVAGTGAHPGAGREAPRP
jgi:nucleotide-binding universal stress UspA family protein